MNKLTNVLIGLTLTVAATSAGAAVIDFKGMANTVPGEGGHQPLVVGDATINGFYDDGSGGGKSTVYAYLDAAWGGLGVCKKVTAADAQCDPGSDDNTQEGESLGFVFSKDITITSILFNNRHDVDQSLLDDTINIGGIDYMFTAADGAVNDNWTYSGVIDLTAGTSLDLSWVNESFYVTSIEYEYNVPEPAMLGLLALGLIGIGVSKRKKA